MYEEVRNHKTAVDFVREASVAQEAAGRRPGSGAQALRAADAGRGREGLPVPPGEPAAPALLSRDRGAREDHLPHAQARRVDGVGRIRGPAPDHARREGALPRPQRLPVDEELGQGRAAADELHPDQARLPARGHPFDRAPALLRGAALRERRPDEPGRRVAREQHRDDRQVPGRDQRPARQARQLRPASQAAADSRVCQRARGPGSAAT